MSDNLNAERAKVLLNIGEWYKQEASQPLRVLDIATRNGLDLDAAQRTVDFLEGENLIRGTTGNGCLQYGPPRRNAIGTSERSRERRLARGLHRGTT